MRGDETQSEEEPLFPGDFVSPRAFQRARKRLETHLFAHREVLSPKPQPVAPLYPPPTPPASSQEHLDRLNAFLAELKTRPRPRLRPGRRTLCVGKCRWHFLRPPTMN